MSDTNKIPQAEVTIVMPSGANGPETDYLLDAILRAIAQSYAEPGQWAEKYGVHVDNEIFMMHPFCWCEREDCPWCWDETEHGERAPNFHYKPAGLKVWWYKYIGRGMATNLGVDGFGADAVELAEVLVRCLKPKEEMR